MSDADARASGGRYEGLTDTEGEALARVLAAAEAAPNQLIVIAGPTASGKSSLALAVAEALPGGGEIVSADSVQIVRGFDIGSGKPTTAERDRVRHHLIDAVDPGDPMDASRFAAMADAAVADTISRGKRPIVCGGTYLWIRALVYGLVEAPAADEATRKAHRELVDREGAGALHARLRRVDPEAADRLHPNDLVRVSRALEVFETTGQKLSTLQAAHGFAAMRIPSLMFGIAREGEELTRRIRARVRQMLDAGWIAETRALIAAGHGESRAMASVGYREVAGFVRGELPESELEDAIVRATRVYARRQRTFLKQAPIEWLSSCGIE